MCVCGRRDIGLRQCGLRFRSRVVKIATKNGRHFIYRRSALSQGRLPSLMVNSDVNDNVKGCRGRSLVNGIAVQ